MYTTLLHGRKALSERPRRLSHRRHLEEFQRFDCAGLVRAKVARPLINSSSLGPLDRHKPTPHTTSTVSCSHPAPSPSPSTPCYPYVRMLCRSSAAQCPSIAWCPGRPRLDSRRISAITSRHEEHISHAALVRWFRYPSRLAGRETRFVGPIQHVKADPGRGARSEARRPRFSRWRLRSR